jgi:hypothetical protein
MTTMKVIRTILGFSGWILAIWLYNTPSSPVEYRQEQFKSFAEAMLNHEGTPAHVIRWDKGVYARLESGAEIVHANYGPVSAVFDPPKDWCYNEVILHQDRIGENYCPSYGMYAGRRVDSFEDLPSAVQNVVLEGRRLAKEKWGL